MNEIIDAIDRDDPTHLGDHLNKADKKEEAGKLIDTADETRVQELRMKLTTLRARADITSDAAISQHLLDLSVRADRRREALEKKAETDKVNAVLEKVKTSSVAVTDIDLVPSDKMGKTLQDIVAIPDANLDAILKGINKQLQAIGPAADPDSLKLKLWLTEVRGEVQHRIDDAKTREESVRANVVTTPASGATAPTPSALKETGNAFAETGKSLGKAGSGILDLLSKGATITTTKLNDAYQFANSEPDPVKRAIYQAGFLALPAIPIILLWKWAKSRGRKEGQALAAPGATPPAPPSKLKTVSKWVLWLTGLGVAATAIGMSMKNGPHTTHRNP